uniref:Uncharacterized protein n=1 Tax=Plectus sambesii TaxID=2011161 RepID=A0A914W809_9BILA
MSAELSNYKCAQVSKRLSPVWCPSLPRYIHQRRRFPPIKIKHGDGCVGRSTHALGGTPSTHLHQCRGRTGDGARPFPLRISTDLIFASVANSTRLPRPFRPPCRSFAARNMRRTRRALSRGPSTAALRH